MVYYTKVNTLLLLNFVASSTPRTSAFTVNNPIITSPRHADSCNQKQQPFLPLFVKKEIDNTSTETDLNPLTKASWYAVEAFGKIFGDKNDNVATVASGSAIDLSVKPSSINEAFRRIQMDNDRSYFLSGEVDVEAYDEECVFSDPFVAFSGRQRFVDNLANLGSFITEYDARMLDYDKDESSSTVKTRLMVKLRLNLPWKPVLAWPWGVRYLIDPETLLITEHEESWDIEPLEGVKQIFRPGKVEIKKSVER